MIWPQPRRDAQFRIRPELRGHPRGIGQTCEAKRRCRPATGVGYQIGPYGMLKLSLSFPHVREAELIDRGIA